MDIEQLAGTKLGDYEIETLLGRFGMGVLYKASQVSLNRVIALKILSPAFSHGNVKLMVFGLARHSSEVSSLTESGAVLGTIGYMSAEHCLGEVR